MLGEKILLGGHDLQEFALPVKVDQFLSVLMVGGQRHSRDDGDDGDDNQELGQGKPRSPAFMNRRLMRMARRRRLSC